MLQGKHRRVLESTWASSGRARWAVLPSVLCPHPPSLNYCGWTPASRSTSVHYYIQCVKHRGPEGFQRNAPLNRTCRVNGLRVHTSECMCVYGGGCSSGGVTHGRTNISSAITPLIRSPAAPVPAFHPPSDADPALWLAPGDHVHVCEVKCQLE